jgi:hypothetical protein
MGGPGGYWGRVAFDDTAARIVEARATRDRTRVVAVTPRGAVVNLWLSADGDGLTGRWGWGRRWGDLACGPK